MSAKDDHAKRIQAERMLMEQTGASRTQIRDAFFGSPLRDALSRIQAAQQPSVSTPQTPEIKSTQTEFKAQPLIQNNQVAQVAEGSAGPGGTVDMEVVENGVLVIYRVAATYVSPA